MIARSRSPRFCLLAAVAVLAAACSRPVPVALLTVDTLRADHLGTYNYGRDTDPALRRLAADSVVFTRAFTTRGKTTPAYASMLTGLYPYRHGLQSLGDELAGANETVAETLEGAGYRTAGFVSSTVMIGRLSGMHQGFGVYDDRMPRREEGRDNFERRATGTIDVASRWLRGNAELPFLFVHLIDPHGPYAAPTAFRGRFLSAGAQGQPLPPNLVPGFQRIGEARTLTDFVDAYDAEIAYADSELGRLIDVLRSLGIYERALIVVTADHGESLGEHGAYFRHGSHLGDSIMRVPLIVKPPGGRAADIPERWRGAVSVIDVTPTILDYAGLGSGERLDGVSLRPIVEGRGGDAERVVFSEKPAGPLPRSAAHHRTGSVLARGECISRLVESADCASDLVAAVDMAPARSRRARLALVRSLSDQLAHMAEVRLPFSVRRRYDPGDKHFVRGFVAEHNRRFRRSRAAVAYEDAGAFEPADLEALRSLGYVD